MVAKGRERELTDLMRRPSSGSANSRLTGLLPVPSSSRSSTTLDLGVDPLAGDVLRSEPDPSALGVFFSLSERETLRALGPISSVDVDGPRLVGKDTGEGSVLAGGMNIVIGNVDSGSRVRVGSERVCERERVRGIVNGARVVVISGECADGSRVGYIYTSGIVG